MKKIKVGRAWIVTYQSLNHYKHLNNRVISVLKWQKSPEQIYDHIIQLYVDNRLSPSERVAFLKKRHFEGLIYKPKITCIKRKTTITIGHDPILKARHVKNLTATYEDSKEEKWSWEEI